VRWRDEGRRAEEVAVLAGVSRPTVNTWICGHHDHGVPALAGQAGQGSRVGAGADPGVDPDDPPAVTGLTHWSSREMATYQARHENIVSHNFIFIADLWRIRELREVPPIYSKGRAEPDGLRNSARTAFRMDICGISLELDWLHCGL
jgi:hypothetical protein